MADDTGYTLSRKNFDRLRRVTRAYESTPREGARRRRSPPVFQPQAATTVYQAVSGIRLHYTTPANPESLAFQEPVVIAVEIGETSGDALRNLTHQQVKQINQVLVARGIITGDGLIDDRLFDAYAADDTILAVTRGQLGNAVGLTMLRTRWCEGWIGIGSTVVGNATEAWYGVGGEVHRVVVEGTAGGDGLWLAKLEANFAAIVHATVPESDLLYDWIVVRDRLETIEEGDAVYVEFPQQIWFDDDRAYNPEHWFGTSLGTLPVFEAINLPSDSGGDLTVEAVSQQNKIAGQACNFTVDGDTVEAQVTDGAVLTGNNYLLQWVVDHWIVLDPELSLSGISGGFIPAGGAGNFTVGGATISAACTFGLVLTGQSCELLWVGQLFVVVNPTLAVTGTSAAFFQFGDPPGNFTVDGNTIVASLSRGLVLNAKEYGLVWADGDHWAVVDPELTITGTSQQFFQVSDGNGDFTVDGATVNATLSRGLVLDAKDYGLIWSDDHWAVADPELSASATAAAYISAGGSGNFTVAGDTVAADVTKGIALNGTTYRLTWVDDAWVCADPTTSVSGKTDASHAKSASGTISIWAGTLGSESDTTQNITAYNRYADLASTKWVECHWQDGSGGWVLTTAECGS